MTMDVMSPAAVLTEAAAVSSTKPSSSKVDHGWQHQGQRRGTAEARKDAHHEPDRDSSGQVERRRPLQQLLQATRQCCERLAPSTLTDDRSNLVEHLAPRRNDAEPLLDRLG